MGRIIALHSYKGGTGKTLLSINLATTYAKQGKDVCLLDLDFRAPSLHAAFRANNNEYWLNDYLNGTCEIKRVLIDLSHQRAGKGRFLVGFADPATEAIREMSAKDRKWEMRALGRLLSLKNSLINDMHLDYLILDTSPGLQYSSINAIVSADAALVVTSIDRSDVKGTRRMIQELYDLFDKKTGIVMNKVPIEKLSSKKEKGNFLTQFNNLHTLPIIGAIPCFCDVLRAGGSYIFTEEKPEHPFTTALERIAAKIEKF
jgi:MinD-like ATPase involved in chromosome partitioning or flagellar assembly